MASDAAAALLVVCGGIENVIIDYRAPVLMVMRIETLQRHFGVPAE